MTKITFDQTLTALRAAVEAKPEGYVYPVLSDYFPAQCEYAISDSGDTTKTLLNPGEKWVPSCIVGTVLVDLAPTNDEAKLQHLMGKLVQEGGTSDNAELTFERFFQLEEHPFTLKASKLLSLAQQYQDKREHTWAEAVDTAFDETELAWSMHRYPEDEDDF